MRLDKKILCGFLAAVGAFLAGCSGKSDAPVRTYRMGEYAQAGPLIYTVYDTEWKSELGEGPSAKIPSNRFLILRLTVTNSGGKELGVPQMTLQENSGKSYPEISEAPGVPKWLGILRNIKPAETLQGRVVFDVPPTAYTLRVSYDDPAGETAALVQIPFQLQTEPQPEASRK